MPNERKSNWDFLNRHRVNNDRSVPPEYWSTPDDGFNGMFRFPVGSDTVRCLASDGMGWQHVSVTIEGDKRPPRWGVMCMVKDLFWDPEDVVVQYHPRRSQYVNHHPGCLHLWRPLTQRLPEPDPIMVGPLK